MNMSTIQTKYSYKRVNQFLKEGENILNDSFDKKIFKDYYDYLISIENKYETILPKLRFVYLLEQYLISIGNNFKTFTK